MTDCSQLYRIEGRPTEWRAPVQEAIDWLCSPEGEHIGDELLKKAFACRSKPLTIRLSNNERCHYDVPSHTLFANLRHLRTVRFAAANDVLFTPSLESVLAHELTHAGQPPNEHLGRQMERADNQADYHARMFTKAAMIEEKRQMERLMRAAPDKETVTLLLNEYFDRFEAPKILIQQKFLKNSPAYMEYIEQYEKPAVENERRVAQLRGEPQRVSYLSEGIAPGERQRKIADIAHRIGAYDRFNSFWHPHARSANVGASTGVQL